MSCDALRMVTADGDVDSRSDDNVGKDWDIGKKGMW